MSALLGRIPSAVGYQPTLATDLGGLQERITTTTKGSITSVQVSKGVDEMGNACDRAAVVVLRFVAAQLSSCGAEHKSAPSEHIVPVHLLLCNHSYARLTTD